MSPNHEVRIAALCGSLLVISDTVVWASCENRPGIPTDLIAKNTAPGEISLNWQPTDNSHCFDIEVSKDGKPVSQSITGGNCGKTVIVFKDLGYNQNYCFNVRARTESGTQGCVSARPSNTACSGTSNLPLTTGQPPASNTQFMVGVEFTGPTYSNQILEHSDAAACQLTCQKDMQCKAWEWDNLDTKSICFLMSTVGPTKPNPRMTSGTKG